MCWDRSGSNSVAAKKVPYALLQARGETGALYNNHWLVSGAQLGASNGSSTHMAAHTAYCYEWLAAAVVTTKCIGHGCLSVFCTGCARVVSVHVLYESLTSPLGGCKWCRRHSTQGCCLLHACDCSGFLQILQ
jgi:hypothetical protein